MAKDQLENLKAKLKIVEDKLEEAADEARVLESSGQELPNRFWEELDNCKDYLNTTRASILRKV